MLRALAFAAVTFLAAPSLVASAAAADLAPDQQSAICGARKTCKTTTADAGQGPGNVALTIVDAHFDLADKPQDAPEEGCMGDPEAADAPERDGGREIWLIAGAVAPKRILALC